MAKNKLSYTEPYAISYLRMCNYKMNTYDLKNYEHNSTECLTIRPTQYNKNGQIKNATYENIIYVLENG